MSQSFQNYIGGRWVAARSGKTVFNLNPATGETLGDYPSSGPEDVDAAVDAGATCVSKPAGDTPEMAWHFTKVFEEAGLPPGVLNLVFGSGANVGNPMVEHDRIGVISFTGSTEVGLGIAGRGGALGKRIPLSAGGQNAIYPMGIGAPAAGHQR